MMYKVCLMILMSAAAVRGLMFHLQPDSRKCLREELAQNVLIVGNYEVSGTNFQRVDYTVTDSKGHIFSQKENIISGKFSFISEVVDMYEICFISFPSPDVKPFVQEVSLLIKTGVEAKSYTDVAETANLKPLEIELQRLEELSESIVGQFERMKKSEEEMRNTNESTSNRVFYLSIFSIVILLSMATWQILYLRHYFKTKKLID